MESLNNLSKYKKGEKFLYWFPYGGACVWVSSRPFGISYFSKNRKTWGGR